MQAFILLLAITYTVSGSPTKWTVTSPHDTRTIPATAVKLSDNCVVSEVITYYPDIETREVSCGENNVSIVYCAKGDDDVSRTVDGFSVRCVR